MAIQNYFVLTSAQRTAAMTHNTDDVAVDPRAIDGASPGVGLNLNDNATGYAPGASVALTGNYVTPSAVLNDPQYQQYAPDLVAYLADKPWCALEDQTIFAPPPHHGG
jgi:hypothetical protein